nr:hypothetical protein GCM10020063_066330 [Dactylosporangium thailandense]
MHVCTPRVMRSSGCARMCMTRAKRTLDRAATRHRAKRTSTARVYARPAQRERPAARPLDLRGANVRQRAYVHDPRNANILPPIRSTCAVQTSDSARMCTTRAKRTSGCARACDLRGAVVWLRVCGRLARRG